MKIKFKVVKNEDQTVHGAGELEFPDNMPAIQVWENINSRQIPAIFSQLFNVNLEFDTEKERDDFQARLKADIDALNSVIVGPDGQKPGSGKIITMQ